MATHDGDKTVLEFSAIFLLVRESGASIAISSRAAERCRDRNAPECGDGVEVQVGPSLEPRHSAFGPREC